MHSEDASNLERRVASDEGHHGEYTFVQRSADEDEDADADGEIDVEEPKQEPFFDVWQVKLEDADDSTQDAANDGMLLDVIGDEREPSGPPGVSVHSHSRISIAY
jgi:hypothetical protein